MIRFPPSSPSSAFASPSSLLATAATVSSSSEAANLSRQHQLPSTVLIPVQLTRTLYSQLVMQRFFPPKVFEKVGWMNGIAMSSKTADENSEEGDEERWRSLGMKIVSINLPPFSLFSSKRDTMRRKLMNTSRYTSKACGFEMIYSSTATSSTSSSSSFPLTSTSNVFKGSSDPAYRSFVNRLQTTGYFGEEIQGSKEWMRKEEIIAECWSKVVESEKYVHRFPLTAFRFPVFSLPCSTLPQ